MTKKQSIMPTTIRLAITPQTNVRSTQGDKIFFQIPEECPHHCGQPRRSSKQPIIEVKVLKARKDGSVKEVVKKVRAGCPHMLSEDGLKRKRRLEKYNEYKASLLTLAKQKGYTLQTSGTAVYFFIPIPARWPASKRKALHGRLHNCKPDIDNLLKAFFDALSLKDEVVGSITTAKYWVDTLQRAGGKTIKGSGWIEVQTNVPVYDPFGVINKKSNEIGKIMAETLNMNLQVKPPRNLPKEYDGEKKDVLIADEIAFGLFKDADGVEIVPDKMSAADFQEHFKGRARNSKRKH